MLKRACEGLVMRQVLLIKDQQMLQRILRGLKTHLNLNVGSRKMCWKSLHNYGASHSTNIDNIKCMENKR